jgi:hypothetical protein
MRRLRVESGVIGTQFTTQTARASGALSQPGHLVERASARSIDLVSTSAVKEL